MSDALEDFNSERQSVAASVLVVQRESLPVDSPAGQRQSVPAGSPASPKESLPAADPPEDYLPNFQWMREKVGEVLVQGIAETLLLRPHDPIEYLGQWLAQSAKNVQLAKKLQEEKAQMQAELEERRQVLEDRQKKAQDKLAREEAKRHAAHKAQADAKEKVEAEQRARELEQMRAERTENRPPPAFGIPETIVEVPSIASVAEDSKTNV